MRALTAALFSVAVLVPPCRAQDAAALTAREQKLAAKAVPALHAIADGMQAQKQHLRAFELRRDIWLEYAEDDDKAREKCGFVKVGNAWRKDDSRPVLDKDMKGDVRVLKKLEQDYATLCKDLVAEHRALAAEWTKVGDGNKAQRHWQRVLRLVPGDKEASAAMLLQPFEGFYGTPAEVCMLQRARTIRGACDWLRRTEFPTTPLAPKQQPLLVAAKIPHIGVRSEHFEVWGTMTPADLQTLAQDCERALLLAYTLCGTRRGTRFTPVRMRNMVFLTDAAHYGALLDQCADQFDAARLKFLKNDVDQAFVSSTAGALRVHKAHLGVEASRDQVVRGVVQDALGVATDGLYEGLGHAACGFLFGRTLTFLLEQQKERTATTWTQRALAPELGVWMKIAEESAWSKSDTRTSELVLLSAARFSTEQRVKAWAMCHYLLHWRPELLMELDESQSPENRSAPGVEAEFTRRTKLDLPAIDREWREFWGHNTELRAAMAVDPIPAEKPSPGDKTTPAERAADRAAKLRARSLVDAVNAQRAAACSGPAGFFVAAGPDVVAVQKYDEQLAKAESDRKKKPKEDIPLPAAPPMLGRTVLWSRQKDAAAAVADWMRNPVQRDQLVHPGRELFGAGTYGGAWLLDVAVAAVPTRKGPPQCWPRDRQKDVPGSAVVGELGPRAIALLSAQGKQATDTVGMPISLHFLRAIDPLTLSGVAIKVYAGNLAAHGVLVGYGAVGNAAGNPAGDPAGSAEAPPEVADGCIAFVPLEPLPSGAEVEVRWELPPKVLAKGEAFPSLTFTVK